jgi:hypothetical protein
LLPVLELPQRAVRLRRYHGEQQIQHVLGEIGKPATVGETEGWFRTYDLEHATDSCFTGNSFNTTFANGISKPG